MKKAATDTHRAIAVLPPDYSNALNTQPDWAAAVAQYSTGEKRTLLPVRVRECALKGFWPQIVYI